MHLQVNEVEVIQSPFLCEAQVGATEVIYILHGRALNLYIKKHSDLSTSSPLYTHTRACVG